MSTDCDSDNNQARILQDEYTAATVDQQKAIDRVFIALCGSAIPGRHLTHWKQKTYFLRFRKHKPNKINGITFLETRKLGDF